MRSSGSSKGRYDARKAGESAIATCIILTLLVVVAGVAAYSAVSAISGESPDGVKGFDDAASKLDPEADAQQNGKENFCRGLEHVELWGEAVNWGNDNLVKSAAECCAQCKAQCEPGSECKCNSWVFCADEKTCADKYRQCWLKKQADVLKPDVHGFSSDVGWTSGIIHGDGEGIIALQTSEGNIRIKLRPDWAPYTVNYIRDVIALRHCTGCQLYRGEGLGVGWDNNGNRLPGTPPGPPYALLQGSLYTEGLKYKAIPREAAPVVQRGHVCLIGDGPDFFVSLAHHPEWGNGHTVFGEVVEGDMEIVDKIVTERPTKAAKWGAVNVLEFVEPLEFLPVKASA